MEFFLTFVIGAVIGSIVVGPMTKGFKTPLRVAFIAVAGVLGGIFALIYAITLRGG